MELKLKKTERGFGFIEFKDKYNIQCSIQKSSLATEDAIWFGVDDAEPRIMSSDAIRLGLKKREYSENDNGWCGYNLPDEVLINTRMHLTQKQVKELLPILQNFVETGELVNAQ